ncbi:MAG: pitrilysin family protein [Bacteroidota bacterium]
MKKILILLLFTLHSSFITVTVAQTFPSIEQFQLPNKLKVYIIPFGDVAATQVTLYINCGQKNEIPGQQYYSQIVASSLLFGCEKFDRDSLQDELFRMGTGISASANENYTTVTAKYLTKDLDKGMDIFSSAIMKPLFPDEDLKQEISQLVDFNNLEKLDIGNMTSVFSDLMVYGTDNPLGRYFYKDQLIKITPAVLKDFYSFNYTPGNSKLVICGKFDAAQVKQFVEKYFSSWTAPYGEVNGVNYAIAPVKKKEIAFVNRSNATQAALQWNKIGPAPTSHEADVFRLANFVFSQVLFKEIREKGGKTYGINSSYDPNSGSPVFTIRTQVRAEETKNTMDLFDVTLQNFYNNGITAAQLKTAKNNYEKSIKGMSDPGAITAFFNPVLYSNPELRKGYLAALQLISLDEVNKLIKKYYTPDSYKLLIAGNEASVAPQFPDWSAMKKFTPADISKM